MLDTFTRTQGKEVDEVLDKNIEIPMLLDIYGNALPKVQRDSLDMYYSSDLSLGEIADNTGKSRQSVFDTIKRGEHKLEQMEENLKILAKSEVLQNKIEGIKSLLMKIKMCHDGNEVSGLVDLIFDEVERLKF